MIYWVTKKPLIFSLTQVCRHGRMDALLKGRSLGAQDSVTYVVNDPTRVNISATYFEATR